MFDKLFEQVKELELVNKDFTIYKNARDARKLLQQIKVEAQNLRNKVNNNFKNKIKTEETISHKVTEEEIKNNNLEEVLEEGDEIEIPVEETELVDENSDDFFDKQ